MDLLLIPTGGPRVTLELDEALALWDKLRPSVIILMHFRNQQCNFPKYGVDDLVKLRPGAIQSGKNEAEFTAGRLPTGQILTLDSAL